MNRPNGCPECKGTDLEFELDRFFCLSCGLHIDLDGNAMPRDAVFHAPPKDQFAVQHGA